MITETVGGGDRIHNNDMRGPGRKPSGKPTCEDWQQERNSRGW